MSSQTMQSGIVPFITIKEGLAFLGNSAPSGRQNLEARVSNPLLFGKYMDSKDIRLYGGMNDDQRYRFKEDFSFNLPFIEGYKLNLNRDCSIPIDNAQYAQSQGAEFILIGQEELSGTDNVYAISSKKYDDVKSALNSARSSGKRFSVDELVNAGGFKVNKSLTVDENIKLKDGRNVLELKTEDIGKLSLADFEYIHAGWHEHFTGSNNATPEQYLEGAKLYVIYLQKTKENISFQNGKGMGFSVETRVEDYKARSWLVSSSDGLSWAGNSLSFLNSGQFLMFGDKLREILAARAVDAKKHPNRLEYPD